MNSKKNDLPKKVKKILIAIDGHSSCGKSTMAKGLALALDYVYIDTGAMYRAITLKCLQKKINIDREEDLKNMLDTTRIEYDHDDGRLVLLLDGNEIEELIRLPEVAKWVSPVARIPLVRKYLVDIQRKTGYSFDGVVIDGRDIGTVVFPEAPLKLFVTADLEIRAKRRYDELISKGVEISYEMVRENLSLRDHIDSTREDSPLKMAEDAVIIDTTCHTPESQLKLALDITLKKIEEL